MKLPGGKARIAGALALLLPLVPLLNSGQASAQDTPVFTLPTSRPTSNPRAAGPVDDENPVVRGPAARPSPAPTIAPAPVATQSAGQPGTAASARPAVRPTTQPSPRTASTSPARATGAPAAAPAPATLTPPTPESGAPLPAPQPGVTATDSFALPKLTESAPTDAPGWYWPWIAGGAAVLAGLFALLWWRRRPETLALEFEPPVVAKPEPKPKPKPSPAPVPTPATAAPPPAVIPASGLGIALEARRMSASLMATTLSYTLKLTNHSTEPLSALAVEGDMVSAHASLAPDKQIAGSAQRLELRHALVTLAPGESAEFTGDFRLPLNAITPIRAGAAAYFVPLARLRVEASQPSGAQMVEVQTFVVGELPEAPGAALRPFRLDLGPRTYSRLGQRAVG